MYEVILLHQSYLFLYLEQPDTLCFLLLKEQEIKYIVTLRD